ncbi:hypothetical protein B1757_05410 [Acidithiobacillus marinus]|uniref:Flagellar assembly factor FliW n=1 Tax=Acidithiobacillus marinus TaxID=187490 RepID=A0A2I1DMX8_9PROT|nr:flagellar assembly protein FliW [Acidithiobacillus marinus]PKY11227.1 hypothetical protein B1757_05410 [Acidithiobacillus marinus]
MSTYSTRFGPLSIAEKDIWHCIAPMPGFTELHQFALLHLPSQGPFVWLQSLDDPLITFLLIAPEHFNLRYSQTPHFAKSEKEGITMVMVILPQTENGKLQSNALAPLYFLPDKMQFGQWIVEHQEIVSEPLLTSHLPPAALGAQTVVPLQELSSSDTQVKQPLSTGTA